LDEDLAAWSPRALAALGRKAAAGASLVAAQLTPVERAGLVSAGFELQTGDATPTVARFAPRFASRPLPSAAVQTSDAIVLGAGIAGAAVAQALAQRGLQVTVLDKHPAPAMGASGNAAGLFHGALHGRDGHYAKLYRAAALHAQRCFARAVATQQVAGSVRGLLRLVDEHNALPQMRALLHKQGLPTDYVQAVDADTASALAGVPLHHPAWFFGGGGWVASAEWVRATLSHAQLRFVGGVEVQQLLRDNGQWLLLDAQQRPVARSALLVLANGAAAAPLLAPLGHAAWPTNLSRGQVTQWRSTAGPALQMPVTGDGYVITLHSGQWLCGATRDEVDGSDLDQTPRHADHVLNLLRMQRLTGITAPADSADWQGRVGWRVQSADSLPIAGAVPCARFAASQRQDQVRLLPREAGLFVLTALGSRGLTWAPLLGELIAAQALQEPWPLEQALADAVDPARWQVRAARAATR
jgi:tRNA 5-methylaminomethyl-2-thiouridine biosynthesis bifunctional protein